MYSTVKNCYPPAMQERTIGQMNDKMIDTDCMGKARSAGPLCDAWRYLLAIVTGVLLAIGSDSPCSAVQFTRATLLFEIHQGLRTPSDVAVSDQGRIYIVDGVNHAVKVFSSSGQKLFSFGSQGNGNGQLQYPLGIDIDHSGTVYIADSGNHRIQMFSAEGEFIDKIIIENDGRHPADPTDVAVDESRNRCYAVDNDNHRIAVLDLTKKAVTQTYGTPGSNKLNFRYPFQIALDAEYYLYVVDVINTRVQVLNPQGLFVAYIGGWGVDVGEFFRPKGIAVAPDGRIFVSDSYTGVIQVFDAGGNFYSAVGRADQSAVQRFKTPAGLWVDTRNRLYVVEMLANKVSVYQLKESAP